MIENYFLSNLQKLMDSKNLNQVQLGSLLGISQGTVSAWFSRKSVPGVPTLEKLAEIFNVEPYYFLMRPGTQGEARPTEKADQFRDLIDRIAKENLDQADLADYRANGGAETIIHVMISNYETDKIGFSNEYFKIMRKLAEYVTLDIPTKIRSNAEKMKTKKLAGDQ